MLHEDCDNKGSVAKKKKKENTVFEHEPEGS
jgi:hypothetical protein